MIVDVVVVHRRVVLESPSEQLAEEAGTASASGTRIMKYVRSADAGFVTGACAWSSTTRTPEPERDALRVADLEEATAIGCRLVVDDHTSQLGDEARGRGHVVDREAELQRRLRPTSSVMHGVTLTVL